jgi:hypothetical protein
MMVALHVSVAGLAAIGPRNMGINAAQPVMTAYGQLVYTLEAWDTAVCNIVHLEESITSLFCKGARFKYNPWRT